ncbi:MAG TPA: hypothetical protein VIE65_17370 [Methylobacter sp.]|jgi:elongation factor Ts
MLDKIRELRKRTGMSIGECRSALIESDGDIEAAIILVLQQRSCPKDQSKAARVAAFGRIHSYVHNGSNLAVMVEINCETDFAAKSVSFVRFCESVSMQIAAMDPKWIAVSDIPQSELSQQRHIFLKQIPGMNDKILADLLSGVNHEEFVKFLTILDDQSSKWFKEVCLMEQDSILEPGRTTEDLRSSLASTIGENIVVRRFVRWFVGEGIEKPIQPDYQSEVYGLIDQ